MLQPDYVYYHPDFPLDDAAMVETLVRRRVQKFYGLCDDHADQILINIRAVENGGEKKLMVYAVAYLPPDDDDDGPDDGWGGIDPDGPDPHNKYNNIPLMEELTAHLSEL